MSIQGARTNEHRIAPHLLVRDGEAAIDYFWVSAWLCVILVPLIWLSRRSVASGHGPAGGD